jgi:imidazolonepropionase
MKLLTDLVLAGFDAPTPYGRIDAGVLVLEGDAIAFSGSRSDLPTGMLI